MQNHLYTEPTDTMNQAALDQNTQATLEDTPAGFERREVIWPGTNERISVLMPVPTGSYSLD